MSSEKQSLPEEQPVKKVCKPFRTQLCPLCKTPMGDMPGSRDAYCPNCGFKDPCCE